MRFRGILSMQTKNYHMRNLYEATQCCKVKYNETKRKANINFMAMKHAKRWK